MFDTLLAAFIISSNVTKPGGEAETNGLEEFIPVFVRLGVSPEPVAELDGSLSLNDLSLRPELDGIGTGSDSVVPLVEGCFPVSA